jgi:hypothetical protein
VSAAYNVSGTISYGIPSANQTPQTVPGVNLSTGTAGLSTTTNSSGFYQLLGLAAGGNYTVTPTKSGDVNHAVTSFDAALAARYAAQLITLTPNQFLAGDVSGNGDITAYDAALIAQTAGNLSNPGTAGQWRFLPSSTNYPNLSESKTNQDYLALLMGDISGNWVPTPINQSLAKTEKADTDKADADKTEEVNYQFNHPEQQENADSADDKQQQNQQDQQQNAESAASKSESATAAGIMVDIPDNLTAANGSTVLIPINVGDVTGQGIISYSFTLSFNQNVLQLAATPFETAGTLSSGFTITPNTATNGQINIQAFGTTDLTGSGTLIFLRFNVVGTAGTASNLSFNTFTFNEGTPQSMATGGILTVSGAPPTAASVTVAGRVTNNQGRGIGNVQITLTDSQGNRRTTQTTSFGYYRFNDIGAGETVTLTARSKRYEFNQSSIVRTMNESVSDADFVSNR